MFRRRLGNSYLPPSSCVLRLVVEDRVNAGLTTLTSKFRLYLAKMNWIHDNDIIRSVFAQKCWVPQFSARYSAEISRRGTD